MISITICYKELQALPIESRKHSCFYSYHFVEQKVVTNQAMIQTIINFRVCDLQKVLRDYSSSK